MIGDQCQRPATRCSETLMAHDSKDIVRLTLDLLPSVVISMGGCVAGAKLCNEADARIMGCGVQLADSGYYGYYSQSCSEGDGFSRCIADCVAGASCDDLKIFPTSQDQGCLVGSVGPTALCARACYSGM